MEKLFRVLPVLVWVALVVAWTFPALALGVRFELWGIQLALPLLAGAALTAALLLALAASLSFWQAELILLEYELNPIPLRQGS